MTQQITIPDRSRALVGFRSWRLKYFNPLDGPAYVELYPFSLSQYNGRKSLRSATWRQEDLGIEAGCYRKNWGGGSPHAERLPDKDCLCGVHGFATLRQALDYTQKSSMHPPLVSGIAAVEGKVLRDSKGFRAEKATLLALFDPVEVRTWPVNSDSYAIYERFFGVQVPVHPGAGCAFEEYAGYAAPYVLPPKLPDVPLYLNDEPFYDPVFLREWARARNCELYADTIAGEEIEYTKPWHLRNEGAS